jgi:hypothetical protein
MQLHTMQDPLKLFFDEEILDHTDLAVLEEQSGQLCVCLFEAAVLGVEFALSMRLLGIIHNQSMVILLDSGSSHSFLSSRVAVQVTRVTPLEKPLSVQVANGTQIKCTAHLSQPSGSYKSVNLVLI